MWKLTPFTISISDQIFKDKFVKSGTEVPPIRGLFNMCSVFFYRNSEIWKLGDFYVLLFGLYLDQWPYMVWAPQLKKVKVTAWEKMPNLVIFLF